MATRKYGGIGSDAVAAKTGKTWDQWICLLDQEKAHRLSHKEIAVVLHEKFGVGEWWSQMVTVGYEQAKGLRKVHETKDGFVCHVSKTFACHAGTLYSWWEVNSKRKTWLPEKIHIHRKSKDQSMRITWTDGLKSLNLNFYARGPEKCTLQLSHEKLPDAGAVVKMKGFWKGAMERLEELVNQPAKPVVAMRVKGRRS